VKLNAQELRHGINHSNLMKKIDELTKFELWRDLSGIKRDTRMKGAELILRYLAFRNNRENYFKPLSGFLDDFSSANRGAAPKVVEGWIDDFKNTLELVNFSLGRLAFRIYGRALQPNTSFNSALYDAQMIAFAETKNKKILGRNFDPKNLQHNSLDLLRDEQFENSIKQATSDEAAVKTRIDMYSTLLRNF